MSDELIDAVCSPQVDVYRLDRDARRFQLCGRVGELGVLGGDEQVVVMLGKNVGQLEAGTTRRAGDQG